MLEVGITKNKYKEGYFKEFNIQDMYKVNGVVCFSCSKGLNCKKHKIKKTDKPLTETQIYNLNNPKKKG